MKRKIGLFVEDILKSIKYIEEFAEPLDKEKFSEDILRQSAIIRQLEIIGEAVKNIPDAFRKEHPKIPWKDIAGLRDILSHAYFGVNVERVWNVIEKDLPKFKEELGKIQIDEEKKNY